MRVLERIRIAIRSALWAADRPMPRLRDWVGAPAAGYFPSENPEILKRRAEDAYRNSAVARRAIDFLGNSIIGSVGLNPQFSDAGTQQVWSRWADTADYDGRADWTGLQHLALTTMAVSGECFIVMMIDPEARPVPLSLRILSPDFVDTTKTDSSTRAGIEYDSSGRRTAYHFWQVHPALQTQERSVRIPAEDVIHLFRQLTPGQQRGVSWLAPCLLAMKELDEFLQASLAKQKTAALFCGVVRSPEGANLLNATDSNMPGLEPGAMVKLKPAEDVTFSDPPDSSDFDSFTKVMLRRIASGLNIPYGALSGDYQSVSYASGRHSKIDFQQFAEYVQHGLLVVQLCIPVLRRWLELARSLELIPETGEADTRWIAPSLPLLDPEREVRGMRDAIRAGLASRSEMVRRAGWNAEQIDREIAADNARADELGLTFDSDPRRTSVQGQAQQTSQEVES